MNTGRYNCKIDLIVPAAQVNLSSDSRLQTHDSSFMTKNQDFESRGMQLIDLIEEKAKERDLDLSQLVEELGFTEIYYRKLRNGDRWIGLVGNEKLEKIAEFLDIPLASVYVLAGILKPTDFVRRSDLSMVLRDSLKQMRRNPVLGSFAPNDDDWETTPESVKFMLIMLYQRLTNEELIDKARGIHIPDADSGT